MEHAATSAGLEPGSLRGIIAKKEVELREMQELRVAALEKEHRETEQALATERARIKKLKEDFAYNLKLIDDRDRELAGYDKNFAQLKALLTDRNATIEEQEARIAALDEQVRTLQKRAEAAEDEGKQRISSLRAAADATRAEHDAEVRHLREDAQRQLDEAQRLARQREDAAAQELRDLRARFEQEVRDRELDLRVKTDALNQSQSLNDSRTNQLSSALSEAERERDSLRAALNEANERASKAEQQVKSLSWELDDTRRSKAARVGELEDEVARSAAARQQLLRDYESKMAALLQDCQQLERTCAAQKDEFDTKLLAQTKLANAELEGVRRDLGSELERAKQALAATNAELDRVQMQTKAQAWEAEQVVARQRQDAERSISQYDELVGGLEDALKEAREQVWVLEKQGAADRERIDGLNAALEEARRAAREAKLAVGHAADREQQLRADITQAHLTWEQKLRAREAELSATHEDVVKRLQRQVDEHAAEAKEYHRQLQDARSVLEQRTADLRAAERRTAEQTAEAERDREAAAVELHRCQSEAVSARSRLESELSAVRKELEAARGDLARVTAEFARSEQYRRTEMAATTGGASPSVHPSYLTAAMPPPMSREYMPIPAAAPPAATPRPMPGASFEQESLQRKVVATLEAENARLREQVRDLEAQNERIRGVVSAMRKEMESLQAHASSAESGDSTSLDDTHARLMREMAELRTQQASLESYNKLLVKRNEELAKDLGSSSFEQDEVTFLRTHAKQLTETTGKLRADLTDALDHKHRLGVQVATLQQQLADAGTELQRREQRIFELQEQERDLRRDLADATTAGRAADVDETAALQRRISELETDVRRAFARGEATASEAVRVAQTEAASLKRQLADTVPSGELDAVRSQLEEAQRSVRRLNSEKERLLDISNTLRADLAAASAQHPAAATGNANAANNTSISATAASAERSAAEREAAQRYDQRLSQVESAMRALELRNAELKNELMTARTEPSNSFTPTPVPTHIPATAVRASVPRDVTASPILRPISQRSQHRPSPQRGSSSAGDRPSSASWHLDATPAPSVHSASARARLADARQDLALAGSEMLAEARRTPARMSERTTPSQQKARLKSLQRKRAELVAARKMVRNYNIVADAPASYS